MLANSVVVSFAIDDDVVTANAVTVTGIFKNKNIKDTVIIKTNYLYLKP
ncbi:hypothetical protein LL033_16270 [Clostridium estertheticum]|nr:hypothetical protein [Clostridium estertheticum]WAG54187.1 hypothetical protein LL033_16270 [Clostridium estertheticum]